MNPLLSRGRGTADEPVWLTPEEYQEIRDWVGPRETKLETLPKDQQDSFIKECRAEVVRRWPWWYPGVHVHVG